MRFCRAIDLSMFSRFIDMSCCICRPHRHVDDDVSANCGIIDTSDCQAFRQSLLVRSRMGRICLMGAYRQIVPEGIDAQRHHLRTGKAALLIPPGHAWRLGAVVVWRPSPPWQTEFGRWRVERRHGKPLFVVGVSVRFELRWINRLVGHRTNRHAVALLRRELCPIGDVEPHRGMGGSSPARFEVADDAARQ
jgi:hypothetical protein